VFAALVVHDILSKMQPELEAQAMQRKATGNLGDDGYGFIGFSLAYVVDVNAMLHHQDVAFFFRRFKTLGKPLGARPLPPVLHSLRDSETTTTEAKY
jgi:hypothetical protein